MRTGLGIRSSCPPSLTQKPLGGHVGEELESDWNIECFCPLPDGRWLKSDFVNSKLVSREVGVWLPNSGHPVFITERKLD